MAAVQAGVKRSFQQMRGLGSNSITESPVLQPGEQPVSRQPSHGTSRASTPLEFDHQIEANTKLTRKATFSFEASIVLIGIRGVGCSTLGVLAATAYNRRLIDTDKAFAEATGSSGPVYRKQHGTQQYQQRHNQVLEHTLETYKSNAVIVCNFSDLERSGAKVIHEYAQTHLVVHIDREAEEIHRYLQVLTIERIRQLQQASNSLLRSCSNYEYFNLSETDGPDQTSNVVQAQQHLQNDSRVPATGFLTLKGVEKDFLQFLRNVIGDHNSGAFHSSAYPLSSVGIELRPRTFAVSVSVAQVNTDQVDLDNLQTGADCIELIVHPDRSNVSGMAKAYARLRRATILPILICPTADGSTDDAKRREIIYKALRFGPELCAVDIGIDQAHLAQIVAGKGNSKLIADMALMTRPPEGWNEPKCAQAYTLAAKSGCEFVRITMPAPDITELFAIQSFRDAMAERVIGSEPAPQLIAYGTGSKGRLSRCFNGVLTSVNPPSNAMIAVNTAGLTSNDDLTAKSVTNALFSSFSLQPLRFYVFGGDVSHSLSPAMHDPSYAACGMQYNCTTYSSSEFDDFWKLIKSGDCGGIAVAHPFKTVVAPKVDRLCRHARAIGAVNTVIPVRELDSSGAIPEEARIIAQTRQQGPVLGLYGFNTDWIGIRSCIRKGLSPANAIRPHSSAIVCGAGGMARSAVYSLLSLGVQNIFISNRTIENAIEMSCHYKDRIASGRLSYLLSGTAADVKFRILYGSAWPDGFRLPTIIVNCIPRRSGDGKVIGTSLPEAWLKSPTGGVLVEVAHRLPVSHLYEQIKERARSGWTVMDGFDVLPVQANAQFELFTGRRAPRNLMREEMLKHREQIVK